MVIYICLFLSSFIEESRNTGCLLTKSSSSILINKGGNRLRSSVARLIEFYDSMAELYDRFFTLYSPFYREHYDTLRKSLDHILRSIPKGSLVADIGCGTGYWSRYLSDRGYVVIGLDISSRSVGVLRSRGVEGVVCDARLVPLRGLLFDLAISLGSVVNHIEQLDLFLAGANRILKRGGYLVFDFDNACTIDNLYEALVYRNSVSGFVSSLLSGFRMGYRFFWDLGGYYIRLYSLSEILSSARSSGFDVVSIRPIHVFTSIIPSRVSERGGRIISRVFDALHRLERLGRFLPLSYFFSVSMVVVLRKL